MPRAHQWQEGLGDVGRPEGYAELRRLADEELVQADAEGPRGRKAYRITDAGLAEIRRWLTSTEVDHTIRVQPLLRSLFFWLMDPEDLRAHLDAEARFFAESAAFYRTYADAKDHGAFGDSPQMRSMHVTVEAGIRLYEALASWAEWAKTVPPGGAQPGGFRRLEHAHRLRRARSVRCPRFVGRCGPARVAIT